MSIRMTLLLTLPTIILHQAVAGPPATSGAADSADPPLNTVIAVHGNTDWHIDTANEFLFGEDMSGRITATNHCPDDWHRRHRHVGSTSTSNFYFQRERVDFGGFPDLPDPPPTLGFTFDDTDPYDGVDQGMLFFYAGHGSPDSWDTLGDRARHRYLKLGNGPVGGNLRYYWMCSCEVFAHGPKDCGGGKLHFGCPEEYDGRPDHPEHRNVYERWGPSISPELRMSCGASTEAWCHENQMNQIWYRYNIMGLDVADSFIQGLYVLNPAVVPLCITFGGEDVTDTPLYDEIFTNLENASGTSHLHIQYREEFASLPLADEMALPARAPLLILEAMPLPAAFEGRTWDEGPQWQVAAAPGGLEARIHQSSGAIFMKGERRPTAIEPTLSESEYLKMARSFIQEQGWTDSEFQLARGFRMMLDSATKTGQPGVSLQKNVNLIWRRRIAVDGISAPVLGAGGEILIQMNNDGTVARAAKVGRRVAGVQREAPLKTFDDAFTEALEQIEDLDAYVLEGWEWGYKEEAGNVEQREMGIMFQFTFRPESEQDKQDYPPRTIEIAGML